MYPTIRELNLVIVLLVYTIALFVLYARGESYRQALLRAKAEKRFLIGELNHIKNNKKADK